VERNNMPDRLPILHELFDPSRLPGAAVYGIAFAAAAWVAGRAVRVAVHRALGGHLQRADPMAVKFLGQLARLSIYVVALLAYVYQIPFLRQLSGVWLTSVGVVSIVVGIAAQNTLGNLISGISLLLYRPFRLGDRLQVIAPTGLESGIVESLTLGYTTLQTDDNRRIVIPNSVMANQTSINTSLKATRSPAIVTIILGYAVDIDRARSILTELAKAHAKAVDVASCFVSALSDSGTTMTLTVWCPDAPAAAGVKSDLLEAAKKRFDAEGIFISH
jgi:small-conductance mechanosensitive channel